MTAVLWYWGPVGRRDITPLLQACRAHSGSIYPRGPTRPCILAVLRFQALDGLQYIAYPGFSVVGDCRAPAAHPRPLRVLAASETYSPVGFPLE